MIWRGANLFAALGATLLAAGASTVHYLARPHIFTLVGLTAAVWILERDRRRPERAVWWLVPMTAVWANLHGGFLAWIACLGLVAMGSLWKAALDLPGARRRFHAARRYAGLTAACALATLANPYGWRLHQHIASYLRSDWIKQVVDEFQSPRFRSESMLQFEILLFAGLALIPLLYRQRLLAELLIVVFWAHSALISARHVPLYAFLAAPLCAVEASRLWSSWSARFGRRSVGAALRNCLRDFSAAPQRSSVWVPLALVGMALLPWNWPRDFPDNKFPVAAVNQNIARIAPAGGGSRPRVLTSDQWGDYLIYRFYPKGRVFADGRSDFYGPEVGREYLALLNAAPGWERIMDRYGFDLALLPAEWPLAQLLMRDGHWGVLYLDRQATILERHDKAELNQNPDSTERVHRGRTE
jgi:hypothetical protein